MLLLSFRSFLGVIREMELLVCSDLSSYLLEIRIFSLLFFFLDYSPVLRVPT